jgi:hypothetical protein
VIRDKRRVTVCRRAGPTGWPGPCGGVKGVGLRPEGRNGGGAAEDTRRRGAGASSRVNSERSRQPLDACTHWARAHAGAYTRGARARWAVSHRAESGHAQSVHTVPRASTPVFDAPHSTTPLIFPRDARRRRIGRPAVDRLRATSFSPRSESIRALRVSPCDLPSLRYGLLGAPS